MSKILINALGAERGGAKRHLSNFLVELGRADPRHDYVVLVRQSLPDMQLAEHICVDRFADTRASGWISRMVHDNFELPRRLTTEGFRLLVSLLNSGPFKCPVPHILFQRNSLFYCDGYMARIGTTKKIETILRRRQAIATMARADIVVTPSQAMANMILRSCPTMRGKQIRVLYHGFDASSLGQPLDERYHKLLAKIDHPRLLYVSHPGPHKGFDILFDALAVIRSRGSNAKLIVTLDHEEWSEEVGKYEVQIDRLGLKNSVITLGVVPQVQMGALYRSCDLMVYPSLCESFGFAMLEAIGYGVPIVAADTEINREICGRGALYYSPLDAGEAARRIEDGLRKDIRLELASAGIAKAANFDWSWARYARDFVDLVEPFC